MARHIAWILLILLSASPAVAHARGQQARETRTERPQDPNRWKWWINPDDRRELGISDQQSEAIEQIWASVAPRQRETWHELQRLEADLEKTLKVATADPAQVSEQVEKVEKLRASMTTTRTVMLYRISQILTPEQRIKLEAHRAKRDEARRRQSNRDEPRR
jgi:Spy/CpxP family protein refolding chaperone